MGGVDRVSNLPHDEFTPATILGKEGGREG